MSILGDMLTDEESTYCLGDHVNIILLHSQLNMEKQTKIFEDAPEGQRKIILSTNIAETSVTINDVKYVVDSGKCNISKYNKISKACNFDKEWISKSSACQRKGRAGRVQDGICWRMYSSKKFKEFNEFMQPEIKRLPLEEIVLNIKSLHLDATKNIPNFVNYLVEPPELIMVHTALVS